MSGFKKGLKDGIPIALGYLSVSFTFGLQGVKGGLSWWETVLISICNVTSAGQFAGLDIMLSGGGFWIEMACAQFIINLRYALMSISLSQKADKSLSGIHRWLVGFGVTDEIFVMAMGNIGEVSRQYMYGLIALPVAGWSLGTLIGAAAGKILPEIVISALSIAIYGMFLAIIIPPAKKNKGIAMAAIFAALLSCCFKWLPILNKVSGGFSIIICTVLSAGIMAALMPVKMRRTVNAEYKRFLHLSFHYGRSDLSYSCPAVGNIQGQDNKQICAKLSLLCAICCAWSNDVPVHTILNGKPCGFHSRTYNSLCACIQGKKPYHSCGICLPCKLLRDTYLSAYLNVGAGVLDSPPAKDVAYVLYCY